MNPNLLIDHFHTPLSFCNHVCFLTVCVFQFYKIVHWYQFLLLKDFTYYDCSSSRLSLKMALFFHGWIIFRSIHIWFLYSFICPCIFSLLPCLSCCKCCCSACLCAVLFSCYFYLENPDSPHETLSPLPLPQPLTPTILLSVSMELIALGALYECTQIAFVLPCLPYVSEHNVFRVHPLCSLCQNCLPFRLDNIHCVDGPRSACPSFCWGTHGISSFISHFL